jgi:hypothetical protein
MVAPSHSVAGPGEPKDRVGRVRVSPGASQSMGRVVTRSVSGAFPCL